MGMEAEIRAVQSQETPRVASSPQKPGARPGTDLTSGPWKDLTLPTP